MLQFLQLRDPLVAMDRMTHRFVELGQARLDVFVGVLIGVWGWPGFGLVGGRYFLRYKNKEYFKLSQRWQVLGSFHILNSS